jgi:hypothetical protein
MTMTKRSQTLKRAAPFTAGVLIGLSVVTPVFAATLDAERLQPLLLLGSLVVLLIGLTMKAMAMSRTSTRTGERSHKRTSQAVEAGDLRWQQTRSAIDVALPGNALRLR